MRKATAALVATLLLGAVAHGSPVDVTARGTVVFNAITTPPLNGVTAGQQAVLAFTVDSDNFVEGVPGDTRGYPILPSSFWLSFSGGVAVGLLDPLPDVAYFTLVEGFPVSDGFFVSTSPISPGGVPLAQTPLQFNLDLGYVGTTLGTLDISDAKGVYDFTGLTRFAFNLWQVVPDNVRMDIEFEYLQIQNQPVSTDASSWGGVKALYR